MVIASTSSPGNFFHGSNASPFGQTISSTRNQCRGSRVASYSATPVVDGKIRSISAMQVYENKSHEELRSEDYELHKGFTFSIQNQGNVFQQSNSPFDLRTTPVTSSQSMFGSLSGTSTAAFGPLPSFRFNEGNVGREASNVSTTFGFGITSTPSSWSTSASSNNSIFGTQTYSGFQGTTNQCTVSKQGQRSGVASYSATREIDRANNRYSVERIQSISAMPIYKDKSHEELRWEYCQLCNKGEQKLQGGQFLSSSPIGTSDTSPNISHPAPFEPFKFNLSGPKIGNFITPKNTICTAPTLSQASIPQHTAVFPMPTSNPFQFSNSSVLNIGNSTISTAPTFSPSVNPFSPTNLYPSPSQASIPQPTAVSSMPTFNPFSESMPANNNQFPKISMKLPSPFIGTSFLSKPPESVTISPSIQSTSVTALDSWPFTPNASKLEQTADNGIQPSQAPNGSSTMMQVGSQNINGQQYVPSSTLGKQSSLVMNPFAMESPIHQSTAAKSRLHGISSIPVSKNHSINRRSSLLRTRHVSFRHHSFPAQSPSYWSIGTKVPFFDDEVDRPSPIAPFLPRENPRAWVKNSLSLYSSSNGKGHEIEDNKNSMGLTDDSSIQEEDLSATSNTHQDHVNAVAEKNEADVLAIMPKLSNGEYYMEPSLKELAAKEMAEPGWCSCVNEFVVGRWGYGSIKFLGDTDVRRLDLESIVQFNSQEVIVYPDHRKKPPVGQSLNKHSEVTLLNVRCISKTGKKYVEGHKVHSYKEKLIKKISEQGAEFVSYDPVQGELKFRIQHF